MAKAFLRKGAEVVFEREPFVVERQCSDGVWVFKQAHTGRPLELTSDQLFDAYSEGRLIFVVATPRSITKRQRKSEPTTIRDLPKKELDKTRLRLLFGRAAMGIPLSRARIEAVIEEVWQSLSEKDKPKQKPGWVSVYRWARALGNSGNDPSALVSHNAGKGNRNNRFSDEVIDICETIIETTYLTQERPTIQHALHIAQAEVRAANKLRPKSAQLRKPTRRLVLRLVACIPAFDRYLARFGRDAAIKKFRAVLGNRTTESPLERAEIDHTRMDVFVVDDQTGLPLGRPWLTVMIDSHTRCVLGFNLGFEPPSRASVSRCLRHAFMPKSNLRKEYPDLKNDWGAFGVPAEIVIDNGPEFHSEDFDSLCFEAGTEAHFSPRRVAWFKGKIERFQGTANRGVAITLPGKTFGNIIDRGDYDPKQHALVTLSALRHLIVRWIVDVYHQKQHSALGCSPAQMWGSSIRTEDIPLLNNPLHFDTILGGVENRMLTHKGIEFSGLHYNSPDMVELRRHLGDNLNVEIRVDRSNLGSIVVLHPERRTPYRVPCLRADYAEGLTEWQHRVCKRYARERNKTNGDPDAWLDSLREISEIVSNELKLGKRKGASRERIARWLGNKQPSSTTETVPAVSQHAPILETSMVHPQKAALETPPSISSKPAVSTVTRKRFTPIIEVREATRNTDNALKQGEEQNE